MYNQKIKELEETYKKLDDELFYLQKLQPNDTETVTKMVNKKVDLLKQLGDLRKLQYELDHQIINLNDYDR